ncbi:hypothetical protein D3C79_809350 [compost metagenome]
MLEAGQEVLHHLEGVIPVPVAIFGVEDLDLPVLLHHAAEGVEALVVQGGRNAAQGDYVSLAIQGLGHELGGQLAEGGVIPGHVGILGADVGQPPIDHGDIDPLLLDLGDRLGQGG